MTREQRMCTITLRHLSGIQKGIQTGHCTDDYGIKYREEADYDRWVRKDKTIYVLEAHSVEQLEQAYKDLKKLKVNVEKFKEPDLGNITTAIAFLLDEPVWNTKKYPDGETQKDLAIRRIKNQFQLASN